LRRQVLEGRRLGQYQLKQRLGRGGMGEVYLAEHALLRRPCAVKVIHPERAGDRSTLLRFEREVQATATLTSPHTVEIYDYGHSPDGMFYYVMEYLPGVDLERLVRDHGPLPPGRVIYLLVQLCGALREAHDKRLIHRDIKPSNIILCERGGQFDAVKLLDFGLVREMNAADHREQLTQEGWIAGTPAYLSPEQAQGHVEVDARSDIYSLGAVAYFLLTGRPPFHHRSAMRTVAAHIYEPVVSPQTWQDALPRDLNDVVLRCLEKDPRRRFPDVSHVREALDQCASAQPWTEADARAWWRDLQRG
jgi:serine/threonine-protein kinase